MEVGILMTSLLTAERAEGKPRVKVSWELVATKVLLAWESTVIWFICIEGVIRPLVFSTNSPFKLYTLTCKGFRLGY